MTNLYEIANIICAAFFLSATVGFGFFSGAIFAWRFLGHYFPTLSITANIKGFGRHD